MTFPYKLYLITDRQSLKNLSLEEMVGAAVTAGVTCVQLREKQITTREYIELARSLQLILKEKKIPLFINDNVDIALAVHADGLHVGASDMPYQTLIKILPPSIKIGMTINFPDEIGKLNKMNLAYLGVSAIFPSKVKLDIKHFWQEQELRSLKQLSQHPLIGIGGINDTNINYIPAGTLDGFAVSSIICAQPDIQTVKNYTYKILEEINTYHDER